MHAIRIALAAMAVLALTTTMAFAGRDDAPPSAADFGLETASNASAHDVPVRAEEETEEIADPVEENEESQENEDACETDGTCEPEDGSGDPEVQNGEDDGHCIAPETDDGEVDGDGEPNHGAIVCGAAHAETPDDCANHGQYVRTFANKGYDGEPGECDPDETVEAETDEAETAAAHGGNGNGHGRGKGKGHGRP